MSYDLSFWKQMPDEQLEPQAVYEALCVGIAVDGLEELPTTHILARIAEMFAEGWDRLDAFNWESANGAFQVFTTPQSFRIDCYSLSEEHMNVFIDIGHEFGCALFDPQTGVRFDS